MNAQGKVYLVGAGPGDISYLTLKAQQLLAQAEVVVYDALVDDEALQLVPKTAIQLDVGKRGGKPSTPQAEIDQLLVKYCLSGKRVIRLKSGDPFIFGRSASEIDALVAANCAFEVVPGISAATAAPLLAGIGLTDAAVSNCFAVLTAHDVPALDWEALARLDTLVILMGGKNLAEIVQQLLLYGRSPQTPVAVIKWAGTSQQQIWIADLKNIVAQTYGVALSPVVIVIGEVVKLRDRALPAATVTTDVLTLNCQNTPTVTDIQSSNSTHHLSGKTILVTRSIGQSRQFSDRLISVGATVIEMPTLEIGPPTSWQALDDAIANLSNFDWLILTSTNGVEYFFERLLTQGKDARAIFGIKIAVVGEKTAQSLQQRCLQPDFIPPNVVADSLVENFPEALEGKKVLFPRVETGGREVLVKELTAKGAKVQEVAAYESQCPQQISPEAIDALQRQQVDIITFASSKTVRNFYQLLTTNGGANLEAVCIASIGPQTSKTCQELLGRVDVEAKEYTLEGLAQAIELWAQQ